MNRGIKSKPQSKQTTRTRRQSLKENEDNNVASGGTRCRYSEDGALDACLPSINQILLDSCTEQVRKICTDFIANNSGEAEKFGINLTLNGSRLKVKLDRIDAKFLKNNANLNVDATVIGRITCYCGQECTAYFRCGKKFWKSLEALALTENSVAVDPLNFKAQWNFSNFKNHLNTHNRHYKADKRYCSVESSTRTNANETTGENETTRSTESCEHSENNNSKTDYHSTVALTKNLSSSLLETPARNNALLLKNISAVSLIPAKPFHEESDESQIEIILSWLQNGQPVNSEILSGEKKNE